MLIPEPDAHSYELYCMVVQFLVFLPGLCFEMAMFKVLDSFLQNEINASSPTLWENDSQIAQNECL